ncbi:MAG: hypothetical protein WCD63_03910 [Terrimicrobiaceae bacterium]
MHPVANMALVFTGRMIAALLAANLLPAVILWRFKTIGDWLHRHKAIGVWINSKFWAVWRASNSASLSPPRAP